jgi:hypothetical protein
MIPPQVSAIDPVAVALLLGAFAIAILAPLLVGIGTRRVSARLLGMPLHQQPPWPGIPWPRVLGWIAGLAAFLLILLVVVVGSQLDEVARALLLVFGITVRLGVGALVLALCTLVADRLPREEDLAFHRYSLVAGGTLVAVAAISGLGGLVVLILLLVAIGAVYAGTSSQGRLAEMIGDIAAGMRLRAKKLGRSEVDLGHLEVGVGPIGLLSTVIREEDVERPMRNEHALALLESGDRLEDE